MRSNSLAFGADPCCSGPPGPCKDDVDERCGAAPGRLDDGPGFPERRGSPADLAKSGELVIEDQEYRAKLGANSLTATIKVDSSKTPKEIDLTFTTGENKGKTVKGIYKIAGDDLTICRGLTEKEARPTEFAAPVDSGLLARDLETLENVRQRQPRPRRSPTS